MYIPCAFYISRNKRLKVPGVFIITSSSDFDELYEEAKQRKVPTNGQAKINKTKTGFNFLPAVVLVWKNCCFCFAVILIFTGVKNDNLTF